MGIPATRSDGSRNDSPLDGFIVDVISLEAIEFDADRIRIEYHIDDFRNVVEVEYEPGLLARAAPDAEDREQRLRSFATLMAIVGIARFAPVLPARVDLRKHSAWIHPGWLAFVKACIPRKWSEHRYQALRLDYTGPELLVDDAVLGREAACPVWQKFSTADKRVMVASGSGKDSLLCSLLLQNAGIPHDLVTYFFDLYGNPEEQKTLFSKVAESLDCQKRHAVVLRDNFYPWLSKRMEEFHVIEKLRSAGVTKPFRSEAGEVYFGSLALVPIQVACDIDLQLFGNEKSADAPNTIDEESGEPIAHQWAKSIEGERCFQRMLNEFFPGFGRVSLTKAIHDVKIFDTLFRLSPELPYATNSCNIRKPWCCKCEKCAYVFAGFSAFGEHSKVVEAFGTDMFEDPDVLPIWEELLGLKGNIPWECVGQPQEVQLYFYKMFRKGSKSQALAFFEKEILHPIEDVDAYFQDIERRYTHVYEHHHYMPYWLWEPVKKVLAGGDSTQPEYSESLV